MKKSIPVKTTKSLPLDLGDIRNEISSIDNSLLALLSRRRLLSESVAKTKQVIEKPLRDQEREKELLESLVERAVQLNLDSHYITRLFNLIIEDSVQFQQDYLQSLNNPDLKSSICKSLAVLGGKGAYSYLAAKKYFSNSENSYLACSSFEKVLKSVESGKVDFGVIPIENTTSGGITEVYDLLLASDLTIIGEEKYPVNHCLVAPLKSKIQDISKIAAHPQANRQCNESLDNLTSAEIILVQSTAHALDLVANQEHANTAAIASKEAADLFGLKVLVPNITNQSENFTRFLVLSKEAIKVSLSVQCKTSIALSTGQKPGSLASVLSLFRDADIPLSKLESRPIPEKPWEQMFYIDLVGNISDKHVEQTLDSLSNYCLFLRILGSYQTEDISATQVSPKSLASAKSDTIAKQLLVTNIDDLATSTIDAAGQNTLLLASRKHHPEDTIIPIKTTTIGGDSFIVIAGPKIVESENQIMACAKHAIESGALVLQGSCFTPANSPYSFQGLGYRGLNFLHKAGMSCSLPIITEVLDTIDVKKIAKQTDILQIGAQNMQNISLLKAVGKVNLPVMLCRTFTASINELLNAAEYILSQGNMQVFLCESGVKTDESDTGYKLDLGAIPLIKRQTHLPIMVDVSCAAPDDDLAISLALAAKTLGAHGIITEFETEENKSSIGGHQRLDFNQFTQLMKSLY